jgi:hypothetical protein
MKRYLVAILLAVYTVLLVAAGAEVRAAQTVPARQSPAEPALTLKTAVQSLKDADMFATGGVGFAGTLTPATKAYYYLLTHPKGKEAFRGLLSAPRPATQMFALAGLSILAPEEAEKSYPAYLSSKTLVKTANGCEMGTEPVSQIEEQARKGVFRRQFEARSKVIVTPAQANRGA